MVKLCGGSSKCQTTPRLQGWRKIEKSPLFYHIFELKKNIPQNYPRNGSSHRSPWVEFWICTTFACFLQLFELYIIHAPSILSTTPLFFLYYFFGQIWLTRSKKYFFPSLRVPITLASSLASLFFPLS